MLIASELRDIINSLYDVSKKLNIKWYTKEKWDAHVSHFKSAATTIYNEFNAFAKDADNSNTTTLAQFDRQLQNLVSEAKDILKLWELHELKQVIDRYNDLIIANYNRLNNEAKIEQSNKEKILDQQSDNQKLTQECNKLKGQIIELNKQNETLKTFQSTTLKYCGMFSMLKSVKRFMNHEAFFSEFSKVSDEFSKQLPTTSINVSSSPYISSLSSSIPSVK